ncbi:hypothetical protein Acsp06_36990 [Actinomycetospora sp. NBRC 106375]|nr:hypothetical protein Acsp06_36990 [Actinomycetospora sp. NBRC 106375]
MRAPRSAPAIPSRNVPGGPLATKDVTRRAQRPGPDVRTLTYSAADRRRSNLRDRRSATAGAREATMGDRRDDHLIQEPRIRRVLRRTPTAPPPSTGDEPARVPAPRGGVADESPED